MKEMRRWMMLKLGSILLLREILSCWCTKQRRIERGWDMRRVAEWDVCPRSKDRVSGTFEQSSPSQCTYLSAFGVGHVDDDDDDDDPYGASTSGAGEYVFDNGGEKEDEIIVMGGPSRQTMSSRSRDDRRGKEGDERWHDGRPVLAGFALDPLGVPPDKWFASGSDAD